MSKSAIQNQLQYVIANEQYLKPLLNSGKTDFTDIPELAFNLYCNCLCCHKLIFFCIADGYE